MNDLHDPFLGRPSLEALAGEVQIAFARAARAEAARREEPPSLESLRLLLEDEDLQERLLSPDAGDNLLPILSPETYNWFCHRFWPRGARERAHMTAVASRLLRLSHLRRDAEEALGLKGPVSLPARVAAILGSFALYGTLLCALIVTSPAPPGVPLPPLLADILLWAVAMAAAVPFARLAEPLGLWDLRPGRAGRHALPALLLAGAAVLSAVVSGLLPTPGA